MRVARLRVGIVDVGIEETMEVDSTSGNRLCLLEQDKLDTSFDNLCKTWHLRSYHKDW